MTPQNQSVPVVDGAEDDWEPAPPTYQTREELREDIEVMESFVIKMGGTLKAPRIKPNRFLGEK